MISNTEPRPKKAGFFLPQSQGCQFFQFISPQICFRLLETTHNGEAALGYANLPPCEGRPFFSANKKGPIVVSDVVHTQNLLPVRWGVSAVTYIGGG